MKRTPLARKTPLKAKTGLKRTPMKKKAARNAPDKDEKAYHARVRRLPCMIGNNECEGHTTVSHRPIGGMGMKAGHYQVAALCDAHHTKAFGKCSIEGMGIKAWVRKYGPHEVYEKKTISSLEGNEDA